VVPSANHGLSKSAQSLSGEEAQPELALQT
jgi:hypothetical protein